MVLLALLLTATHALAEELPRIAILATGGTIAGVGRSPTDAGYDAGRLSIEALLVTVPQLREIAELRGEQIANVPSQDMTEEIWLALARRVDALLGTDDVDGIVVTHGTDTLEETAFFLDLVIAGPEPVVLTGAARPATALSADGPRNLLDAVRVAAASAARGRGVMVVFAERIHAAREVTKTAAESVVPFESPSSGPIGSIAAGEVRFAAHAAQRPVRPARFALGDATALPRVEIVYAHAAMGADLIRAAAAAGARGIVVAGVGNGNMSAAAIAALAAAAEKGVVVVRSSRTGAGAVARNIEIDDDALGFVAAGDLNPQKARVLLQLALIRARDPGRVQALFADR